jgi:hypothetical protein
MNKATLRNKIVLVGVLAVLLAAVALVWSGCTDRANIATTPPTEQSAAGVAQTDAAVQSIMSIQDRHTTELMANPNVVGVATGLSPEGKLGILVYAKEDFNSSKNKGTFALPPASLEGVPVYVVVTGEFRAYSGTVSHTAIQTPPIQLGTSGGWANDIANGYCCSGTLVSLVQIGSTQYVLSCWHVFRTDIPTGGSGTQAVNGDPLDQPGLVDISCNAAGGQTVATLAGTSSLPGSNVDCAIGQVVPGMVSTTGSILEIGTISKTTVAAKVGLSVKKSGRTTGLTKSTVSAINGTISVAYETDCAGATAFTKTYTGQIIVANANSAFLGSGDSGSLLVTNTTTNPNAVGLLYAGSTGRNGEAIANPIGQVLSYLGATMVGQ